MAHNPPGGATCNYRLCKPHFDAKEGVTKPLELGREACPECCPMCVAERKAKVAEVKPIKRDDGGWYVGTVKLAQASCGHAAIFCKGCQNPMGKMDALRSVTMLNCGVGAEACCCQRGAGAANEVCAVLADGTQVRAKNRAALYRLLTDPDVVTAIDVAATASAKRPQVKQRGPIACTACEGVLYLCESCVGQVEASKERKPLCVESCDCGNPVGGAVLPDRTIVRGTRDEVTALIGEGVDMNGRVMTATVVEEV